MRRRWYRFLRGLWGSPHDVWCRFGHHWIDVEDRWFRCLYFRDENLGPVCLACWDIYWSPVLWPARAPERERSGA